MSLRDLYKSLVSRGRKPQEPEESASPTGQPVEGKSVHIVLCNDDGEVYEYGLGISRELSRKGHKIQIDVVKTDKDLRRLLKEYETQGRKMPDAFFLDVNGVGEAAAKRIIQQSDRTRPGTEPPHIGFLSLSLHAGIDEAGKLRESEGRFEASFIDASELKWLNNYLEKGKSTLKGLPVSSTFRELLNEKLGTALPLDAESHMYDRYIAAINIPKNNQVLDAFRAGRLEPEEAVERMRGYASGLSESLLSGVYNAGHGADAASDASFYASAGFPVKGPAVFSIDEARAAAQGGARPILFMQSYDPEVVPLMAEGKLGGIVALSPFMASHMQLLCETHMISGLFGLKPQDAGMTSEFNETAPPALPPWFEGNSAEIAGHQVRSGQDVAIGLPGRGISFSPPAGMTTKQVSLSDIDLEGERELRRHLKNLRGIGEAFETIFEQAGEPRHGVKAIVNSDSPGLLGHLGAIGLVRTEQIAAQSSKTMALLKPIFLEASPSTYGDLVGEMRNTYKRLTVKLNEENPVRIRLFDFTHGEVLNKEEQGRFIEKHGRLDIHGGAALAAFPRLYQQQAGAMFSALSESNIYTNTPLEVMMPAVRTEEDALESKKIVDHAARGALIKPGQYKFGVMVETLDACRNIEAIAQHCDFISFGTNDLTQEYFTLPRGDMKRQANFAGKNGYNPYEKLGPEILEIIRDVTERARAVNPNIQIDVCGAQAADPGTAQKLFEAGIDNISVAPSAENLYALPTLLNYRRYDAIEKPELKSGPRSSASSQPVTLSA